MRATRFSRRAIGAIVVFVTLTAVTTGLASAPDSANAASAAVSKRAVLLPRLPFACEMVDDGAEAWVYCWEGFQRVTRHVRLDVDGQVSLTATEPLPSGIGGPGEVAGMWVTIGRFRCEVLRSGVECVAIASGHGFLITRTDIVEVQSPPGVTEPAPELGQSVTLQAGSGYVLIKQPGEKRFSILNQGARVPVGTVVDTSHGTVLLNAAAGAAGGTQAGAFHGGIFRVTQPSSASVASGLPEGLTVLRLAGRLPSGCGPRQARRGNAAAARSGSKGRHLWGNAHGNFQTGGHYASATVGGTKWLTEDSCAGTRVKVSRGVVTVEDFLHHRTVLVKEHESFLAHPGPIAPAADGASSHASLWSALDGKVICGLSIHPPQLPTQLLCASRHVPPPPHSNRLDGDPGFVFLGSTGSPRLAKLSQYSWEEERDLRTVGALTAGSEWRRAGIDVTCTVDATAVRCTNGSGHGFRITKSSYGGF